MSFRNASFQSENCPSPTQNSIKFNKHALPTTSITKDITPLVSSNNESNTEDSEIDGKVQRSSLLGKVSEYLQNSRSRMNSVISADLPASHRRGSESCSDTSSRASPMLSKVSFNQEDMKNVRETNRVFLEYDPISRRRVLNTYEILKEIGRGEHGKVKLAKDLVNNELVAIKIVSRQSKKDRRIRRVSRIQENTNDHEMKIKREIAIMKKCYHKHIVKLKEVLDDINSHKIYLVLEYLEKGEIKWKRKTPIPEKTIIDENEIPCCGSRRKSIEFQHDEEDNCLLSNEYSPNLSFKQSRKIFRDVLLGLEYLHLQGIVHRDIKPANLLVSSDNVVKISDFGVSFASSLNENDDGFLVNEFELAKTAGSPAFFAPELCQTNFSSADGTNSVSATSLEILKNDNLKITKIVPKIDYKIDIWALGVTLYCLLFGKVPFNADSEFELFHVIVNQTLEFPADRNTFNSPMEVSENEFCWAKDLLNKLLDKDRSTRIEIKEIKEHPFVLLDLENDLSSLHELLYLNNDDSLRDNLDFKSDNEIAKEDIDNAIVGFGSRIRKSLYKAIKGNEKDLDSRSKINQQIDTNNKIENYRSSEDSSVESSIQNSSAILNSSPSSGNHSVILSEAFQISSPPQSSSNMLPNYKEKIAKVVNPQLESQLESQPQSQIPLKQQLKLQSQSQQPPFRSTPLMKEGKISNIVLQDVIDSQTSNSSRRGSAVGIPEAPQIETKRNVVGDLYMRNQSIVDTFKDIQQQDDKRRKSSNISTTFSASPSTPTAKNSITSHISNEDPMNVTSIYGPSNTEKQSNNQLKIGPISINGNRRISSVISLPLSESFASLDSINDEYLTQKYQEFTTTRQKNKNNLGNSTDLQPDFSFSLDKTGSNIDNINEKFKKFDLGSSMKSPGNVPESNECGIAPKANPNRKISVSSSSSYSSYTSHSGSEDSDEGGDLTLAFSSKVTPSSRPKFLSLSHRAKSHESNLPRLINNAGPTYSIPVVIRGDEPELEDVPAGLMNNVPRPSISLATNMTPTVSVISSNGSSTTITPDFKNSSSTTTAGPIKNSTSQNSKDQYFLSPLKSKLSDIRAPSNSVKDTPLTITEKINAHQVTPIFSNNPRDNLYNNHYNNHYKKEPIYYPFPNALHLDTDKESFVKANANKDGSLRPNYYRSNSITVGLLQHQHEGESETGFQH